MYLNHFFVVFAVIFAFTTAKSSKCVDGVNNVIRVENIARHDSIIKVHDVQLLIYDVDKKPNCHKGKPLVILPGYMRARSGSADLLKGLKLADGRLMVELTLEQDSFFVGKICEQGKSKNSYVTDDTCAFDLCERIGEENCKLLETPGKITLEQLPEEFQKMIYLPKGTTDLIAGDWKMQIQLTQNRKVLGGVRVGKLKQWTTVAVVEEPHQEL